MLTCGAKDSSGRYTCGLIKGHNGAHMELTDQHSVAWGWLESKGNA